jgi:hypothetical protein
LRSDPSPGVGVPWASPRIGPFHGTLAIASLLDSLSVVLTGTARPAPDCPAAEACRDWQRDPSTLTCVAQPKPDHAACATACLTGTCQGGECVGTPRSCDDEDPCTVDSCDPSSGCLRTAKQCASSDPCHFGRCESGVGCVAEAVPDGTACGPPSVCDGAQICLAGQCVLRQTENGSCLGYPRCGAVHCRAVEVSSHARHACVLTEASNVRCFGSNLAGQLGVSDAGTPSDSPPGDVLLPDAGVLHLVQGGYAWHSCALTGGGELWCWGQNSYGQIDPYSLAPSLAPTHAMGPGVTAAAIGYGAVDYFTSAGTGPVGSPVHDDGVFWSGGDFGLCEVGVLGTVRCSGAWLNDP